MGGRAERHRGKGHGNPRQVSAASADRCADEIWIDHETPKVISKEKSQASSAIGFAISVRKQTHDAPVTRRARGHFFPRYHFCVSTVEWRTCCPTCEGVGRLCERMTRRGSFSPRFREITEFDPSRPTESGTYRGHAEVEPEEHFFPARTKRRPESDVSRICHRAC